MKIKDFLEKYGFKTYESQNEKFNELKEQFMEMGQLKSDFDIEKFTVKKEGNFIAHNFHFLMRQYVLALSELRRMLLEKERLERLIQKYSQMGNQEIYIEDGDGKTTFADIHTRDLERELDLLEVSLVNKAMMVRGFEACRLKLIELNDGKPPTNEQYQQEEPDYWKWFLQKQVIYEHKERMTGIKTGTWLAIDHLEEKPVLNENYQRKLIEGDKGIPINQFINEIEYQKQIDKREEENVSNNKMIEY